MVLSSVFQPSVMPNVPMDWLQGCPPCPILCVHHIHCPVSLCIVLQVQSRCHCLHSSVMPCGSVNPLMEMAFMPIAWVLCLPRPYVTGTDSPSHNLMEWNILWHLTPLEVANLLVTPKKLSTGRLCCQKWQRFWMCVWKVSSCGIMGLLLYSCSIVGPRDLPHLYYEFT